MGAWTGARVEAMFQVTDTMRTTLEEELSWWAARDMDSSAAVTELREGPVVPSILEAARDSNADLIVMGSHGKGGFERLALGSVTEKVLRKAPCPVLVVPAGEGTETRGLPLRRVLCATDFSAPSGRAVDYARQFADASRAPLSLLTVIDWPFGETSGDDPVSTLRGNLEQEAAASLEKLARRGADEPPAEIIVKHGRPGREIVKAARESQADLIVLGISGRGAVDLALLGSTAHHVLRDAPCPVLAVPAASASA